MIKKCQKCNVDFTFLAFRMMEALLLFAKCNALVL